MYIYTDMIEYLSVGNSYAPLLITVHIEGASKDFVSVRFDMSHYAPVNKSNITDIWIEVKDDQNRHVRFTYGKVVAKLHFRPVKQVLTKLLRDYGPRMLYCILPKPSG